MTAEALVSELAKYGHAADAAFLQRFFKTGEGQYGDGDVFIGVRVPATRRVCAQFKKLPLPEIQTLLNSPVHEHRLAAVILLAAQYKAAGVAGREAIFRFYLKNVRAQRVNNWDLVDTSAEFIMGEHLYDRPRDLLFELAKSHSVWERRVAVLASFQFIKHGDASTTLLLAAQLLHDPHDLMQKAVGWMLREVGKRVGRPQLLEFLDAHAAVMPRTMLRYALEHLPPKTRTHYMGLAAQAKRAP